MEAKEKKRLVEFDMLRILACFSVVMLHSAAQSWYSTPVTEMNWLIANSYDAAFRFGVPVFVMISGGLFLNAQGELSLKKLYLGNILRMVVLYLVWSVFYGLFDCRELPLSSWDFDTVFREILGSRYHLWYLPMIIGIYAVVPILKQWVQNAQKQQVEYFLILFMVFQIGRETFLALTKREVVVFLNGMIKMDMVCGYLGYFVLGYYLTHYGIAANREKAIYGLGILSVLANILIGNVLALRAGMAIGEIYDCFGIFTFFIAVALFVLAVEVWGKRTFSEKMSRGIHEVSKGTLGIYLMHVGMIEFLAAKGIHSTMITPLVGIPMLSVLCFLLCGILAAVLRRIPVIGKYLC